MEEGLEEMDQNTDNKFIMSYIYDKNLALSPEAYAEEIKHTVKELDEVSPAYFTLTPEGTLDETRRISHEFIEAMHKESVKVVPFLSDQWNKEVARAALDNKEELVSQVVDMIEQYNLDGVNVDIEHVTKEDRADYNDLVKRLRESLTGEKKVSVAVAANPEGWTDGWHGAYDYSALAQASDELMLMAYDEHFQSHETPGPVASLSFVERSIQYALSKNVPSEKLLLGIPFYGRIWKDDGTVLGLDVSLKIVEELIEKYDGYVEYDQELQSPVATFTIEENDDWSEIEKWEKILTPGTYTLWYENKDSIKAKLALVQKYNLKGTGIWSLGQETEATWNYYKESLNTPYKPE